jgi:hypothetical protein
MDDSRWKAGWRCPRCGEQNPEWFGCCWSCEEDQPAISLPESPPTVEIDGLLFSNLPEFCRHFEERSGLAPCTGNLDRFNEFLRPESGYGAPAGGFIIRWKNHRVSKENLGRLFDEIVEIIRGHGPGGAEASDNVRLELL